MAWSRRGPDHVTDGPAAAAVGEQDRVEQRHVGDVGGEDDVQQRFVDGAAELAVGAEPDLGVRLARLAEPAVRRVVDVPQVDRPRGPPGTSRRPPGRGGRSRAAAPGRWAAWPGRARPASGVWWSRPSSYDLEGRREVEDRLAVLDGDHPAGGEGAAVADAVDGVDDGRARVAGAQEVRVQGVGVPVLRGPCARRRPAPGPRPARRRRAGRRRTGTGRGRCPPRSAPGRADRGDPVVPGSWQSVVPAGDCRVWLTDPCPWR